MGDAFNGQWVFREYACFYESFWFEEAVWRDGFVCL